jgi:CelD/BcsL family acetyltransferase involved in cellulose biosynthesis
VGAPEVLNIEDSAAVERISGEWLRLVRDLPASSYFPTPDWVVAWWETVARKPPTRLAIWRGVSGQIEALVAVSRGRESVHRKLPVAVPVYVNAGSGVGDADHCGWPVAPGREDEVRDWLTDATVGATAVLRNLDPAMAATIVPRAGWAVDTFACPRLSMPPAGAAIGRSSNFRRQL